MFCKTILATLALLAPLAQACDLKIERARIREAPSSATMLAGYAELTNTGNTKLTITSAQSAAFADVQMHESITTNGMVKMRELRALELAPGAKVSFVPNGKHFMLINPKSALRAGDTVLLKITDDKKCVSTATFKVSKSAAGATGEMDHSPVDHEHMDHSHMHHDHAAP